ncbi:MAG: succinate dehydrogenase, hydrophobic membrane anchor protein [Alphaproteobacteria bacterium]
MSLRTPLGLARGLGSAKEGTDHWWAQKVTSVALVPLTLWFVASLVALTGAGYDEVRAWLASPVAAVLTILFLATTFYHLKLGLQVVIEDYVPIAGQRIALLIGVSFVCILLGAFTIFAVLKISLGS